MTYDVLIYGPVFCDLVFTDISSMPILGKELFAGDFTITVGGSAIVAAGLHRLGARVGLVADLGSDPLSKLSWQFLGEIGLDRSLIKRHPNPLPHVTVAMSFPEDRAFVTRYQAPQEPANLEEILQTQPAKHLHLCSFLTTIEAPNAIQTAHTAGMTVSMDPGWDEKMLNNPRFFELLAELDLFLPNRLELSQITGIEDLDQAANQMMTALPAGKLIVKDGSNGAVAFTIGQQEAVRVPVIPVNPVDTTGAGDAFVAGFLYGFLQGLPVKESMQYGVVCGGLTTTIPGGIAALPNFSEVKEWLSKLQS